MRTLQVMSPRRTPSRSRLANIMRKVYTQAVPLDEGEERAACPGWLPPTPGYHEPNAHLKAKLSGSNECAAGRVRNQPQIGEQRAGPRSDATAAHARSGIRGSC